jgi:uncharacterized lipoprotein
MRSGWGVLFLVPVLAMLSACHSWRSVTSKSCHGGADYMKSKSVPPLIVPPGLDAPDTTNALRLPTLNEPPPPPRHGKDPCLDEPPPYKVQQAKAPQA